MIGHNYVINQLYIPIVFGNGSNIFFYNIAQLGREESRPYDPTEYMLLFVSTYSDKIQSTIIIVPVGTELMSFSH
ncbi:MAG: hypothetical protein HDS12_05350 [Bacteroides sp.]|nr:hypothetical protein [Bacteroides sp.]